MADNSANVQLQKIIVLDNNGEIHYPKCENLPKEASKTGQKQRWTLSVPYSCGRVAIAAIAGTLQTVKHRYQCLLREGKTTIGIRVDCGISETHEFIINRRPKLEGE